MSIVGTALLPGASFDPYIQAETALNEIPGLSAALVCDGEVILTRAYGVRSLASAEPMTAGTPVELASLSKSLTGLVA